MASTPRANIADDVIQGLDCAICGKDALRVVHVERLPDYVECAECKSAFIMEDQGERVLYGQIAEGYPQTSQFAHKQWAWIEAVETRAREERPTPEEPTAPEPDNLQKEEPQASSIQEPEPLEPEGRDTVPSEWTIFDDSAPAEEPEAPATEEPIQEFQAEISQEISESQTFDMLGEKVEEEQDLFEGLEDESFQSEQETGMGEPYDSAIEAEAESDEETELEDGDEIPGFAWLGGLADEDSMLEEPDSTLTEEAPPSAEVLEGPPSEEGLSADELDDLFMSDSELAESAPSFAPPLEDVPMSKEELESASSWSTAESDEEDDFSDSWLEGLEVDEQETEEPSPEFGAEQPFAEQVEADQEMDWQAVDSKLDDEPIEEEQPHSAWLQDEASEGLLEPELADESQPSATGFSISDESEDQDFFASLRDSAAIPLESQPLEDQDLEETEQEMVEPSPPSWAIDEDQDEIGAMAARMQAVTASEEPTHIEDELDEEVLEPLEDQIEEEPLQDDVIHYQETDPPPGYRHRVVVGGDHIVFPGGECVHCGRTPVKGQLAIAGTLPEGQGMGDRKPTRFQVPLCGECRDRATALSEDAKSARLQSLLFALIIGMAFVVGALAFRLVSPANMRLADWFILLILFIIGFAGSAILLLSRINNYPPPMDAAYVRTTLLIPSETQGLETAFEWRNEEYAQRFYEANQSNVLGNITRVKDRLNLGESK